MGCMSYFDRPPSRNRRQVKPATLGCQGKFSTIDRQFLEYILTTSTLVRYKFPLLALSGHHVHRKAVSQCTVLTVTVQTDYYRLMRRRKRCHKHELL